MMTMKNCTKFLRMPRPLCARPTWTSTLSNFTECAITSTIVIGDSIRGWSRRKSCSKKRWRWLHNQATLIKRVWLYLIVKGELSYRFHLCLWLQEWGTLKISPKMTEWWVQGEIDLPKLKPISEKTNKNKRIRKELQAVLLHSRMIRLWKLPTQLWSLSRLKMLEIPLIISRMELRNKKCRSK